MKLGLIFPELVHLIEIPKGLKTQNYKGEELYRRGFLSGLAGTKPMPCGDMSFRQGWLDGIRHN